MDTIWHPDLLQNGIAKYRALLDAIHNALNTGQISHGDRLLPVREMAWRLQVTPGTVARAYQLGIDEELLEAHVGRGTFIRTPKPETARKTTVFGETHVSPDIIDLRNAAVPDFGQDEILDDLSKQIEIGGEHSMVRYAGHNEMPTRTAMLDWMQLERTRAKPEDLILTYGSQNATIAAFMAILRGTNPVIATDTLVLPGTRRAAELARAKIIGIEGDEDGILPKAFEDICRRDRPQILHLSANITNPTAIQMSLTRKAKIAEIARQYDLQIVEDDGQAKFFATPPPSFLELCPERVWHVSSLSRYLAAGLRIGFLLCPPGKGMIGQNVIQSLCHSFSPLIAQLATHFIQSGQADIILEQIRTYRAERVRLAVNQLGCWDIRWNEAADYLWLNLPNPWRASTFSAAAEKTGILVAPADIFLPDDGVAPNAIRLTLGGKYGARIFQEALVRLDHLLDNPPHEMLA
ncbi:MAG: PLP-dependent aminotransferase family protein [Paracoccaceae bacterium]